MTRLATKIPFLALLFFCASLAYGDSTTSTTARKLPPGFEPIAGAGNVEKLDPNPLVVGAYAMFFVAMFGYLIFVARSQSTIAKEMADLAERIRRSEKS